jgi:hypothetical protein
MSSFPLPLRDDASGGAFLMPLLCLVRTPAVFSFPLS